MLMQIKVYQQLESFQKKEVLMTGVKIEEVIKIHLQNKKLTCLVSKS